MVNRFGKERFDCIWSGVHLRDLRGSTVGQAVVAGCLIPEYQGQWRKKKLG